MNIVLAIILIVFGVSGILIFKRSSSAGKKAVDNTLICPSCKDEFKMDHITIAEVCPKCDCKLVRRDDGF